MGVTFGFYNSMDGDRRYNAEQMSAIFDGIIRDGVLYHVGNRFFVRADGGLGVIVGSGRAWLDSTWTLNDVDMSLTVRSAETMLDRIDAIVLEVDRREESRMNSIRWVIGTPSAIAQRPTLINEQFIRQYPIAYIEVPRGVTTITQSHITNMVGTNDLPYVTGPLEIMDATELVAQWNSQWSLLHTSMQNQQTTQQNNWQQQLNNQQTTFQNQIMNVGNTLLAEMNLLYLALETKSFALINNNFDDWSVKRGTDFITTFSPDGKSILQTIKIAALNNFILATRATQFNADGSITEIVKFYPWEHTEGGNTIATTTISIRKDTYFEQDGSIREVVR